MENCPSLKCFYSVLGVEKGSTAAEIRTAYRQLAMSAVRCGKEIKEWARAVRSRNFDFTDQAELAGVRWHPDKCSNAKGDAREQAKLKFQVVQEAYSVLSDETKRLMYDHGLDVDVDPSFHDFMQDLVNKMKEASSSCSKSSTEDDFEEPSNITATVAGTENYSRDCKQFGLNAGTSSPEEPQTKHQPLSSNSPPKPHPNLFKSKGFSEDSFWAECVDGARQFSCEFEQTTTSCPKPHPNLHGVRDLFDHIADHWTDGEIIDLISTQASVFTEPQVSHVTPAQDCVNLATETNFASAFQTSHTENSTTTGCSAASANISSEVFCMGVGGDGPGRVSRGNGKSAKCRRKKR